MANPGAVADAQVLAEVRPGPQSIPFRPFVRFTLKDGRLWAASFLFFSVLFVCGAVSMYPFQKLSGEQPMIEEILILPAIQDTIFALLAPIVFVIAACHPIQGRARVQKSLLYFGGGVLFALLHVFLRLLSYPVWNYAAKKFQWALVDWGSFRLAVDWTALDRILLWNLAEDIFAIYLPIVVIAHAVLYYTRFREREIRAAQLKAQLSDARLLALKSQLHPHFLFNTLHSISALMLKDVRLADTMIARLSDLLRMSLEDEGQHVTSLKRELDFTQAYLDIERIRFGDRLSVSFDVPPQALDATVPHFLLQPFVENSIKHGISRRISGGQILVAAGVSRETLRITIRDNGSGRDHVAGVPGNRGGIGIKATRERLRNLYGEDQDLKLTFLNDGSTEVQISLPFCRDARLTSYGSRITEGVVAFERS
jgi:two-component system LytT family sensor kinase